MESEQANDPTGLPSSNETSIGVFSQVYDLLLTPEFWIGAVVAPVALMLIQHLIKLPRIRFSGRAQSRQQLDNGESCMIGWTNVSLKTRLLGFAIDRPPLLIKSARIYNPETRKFVGLPLRWAVHDDTDPLKRELAIGETARLNLFCIHDNKILPFQDSTIKSIQDASPLMEPNETTKFELRLTDKLDRTYRLQIRITTKLEPNNAAGLQVNFNMKYSLEDRLYDLKYGARAILRGIFGQRL